MVRVVTAETLNEKGRDEDYPAKTIEGLYVERESGKGDQFLPQQLPGPAQVDGGPSVPQHLSAGSAGKLPVGLTPACAEISFLRFRPPQFPHATSSVS